MGKEVNGRRGGKGVNWIRGSGRDKKEEGDKGDKGEGGGRCKWVKREGSSKGGKREGRKRLKGSRNGMGEN